MESPFLEAFVLRGVEAEQLRRASGTARFLFERNEEIEDGEFLAEVALVQFFPENRFVEVLKPGEGELWRQELEADGLIAEFAAKPCEGGFEDGVVVEGEGGRV